MIFPEHLHFDCHTHTRLCGHAIGEPADYVEEAAEQGITLVAVTCHIPMNGERWWQQGVRMRHADLPEYRDLVAAGKARGAEKGVEVLHGIEAEIHPDPEAMKEMEELIHAEGFEFVLGSLHHQLPAFREWLEARDFRTDREKVEAYFTCLADGAASGRYDSIAHPDVIRLYGSLADRFNPADHAGAIKDCLDTVAASGTCLEINTSGMLKGDYVTHPDPLIMEWALERGIPFTIGSDSHAPHMLGQYFGQVLAQFKEMGLKHLHYARNGKRVAVEL